MASKRRRFIQRRKALGFTQESLAHALSVERSTVVRWECGDTEPQPWVRSKIAKMLRIPIEQLHDLLSDTEEAASQTGSPPGGSTVLADMELAEHGAFVAGGLATLSLGSAGRTGAPDSVTVTPEVAADTRAISAGLRRSYRIASAPRLYSSAHAHLKLVLSLHPGDQPPDVRSQLLITAGEMATVCACILGLDLGRWSALGPYLDLAQRAATDTACRELEAVLLASRSFHAAYGLGEKQLGLDFAEAAVTASRHGACCITRGWVAAVASERVADLGDAAANRRLLEQARVALSAPPDDRSWSGIGSFDLPKLTAYEGGNYRRLGDYDSAIRVLDAALAELGPSMRRHRATALIDRAEAHHGCGYIDAACADTQAALALVAETQRADTLHRAETLAQSMPASNARDARRLWNDVLTLQRRP